MNAAFYLGVILILFGVCAVAFPRDKRYLTRLLNLEISGFGLLFVLLSLNETIALMTVIAVNSVSTFIFVRIIERRQG